MNQSLKTDEGVNNIRMDEKFIKTKLETNAPDKRSEMHLHTHPSTLVA